MSYLVDINTEELRNAVNIAQRANAHLTDAMQCLNQVVIHDDWGCPERDSINRNTIENRKAAETLQYNSEMFYKNILYAADRFVQTENEIDQLIGNVDGLLSQFLSLVPQGDSFAGIGAMGGSGFAKTEGARDLKGIVDKWTNANPGFQNAEKGVGDIIGFKGIFDSLTKK